MATRAIVASKATTPVLSHRQSQCDAIDNAYKSETGRRKDITVQLQYLKDDPLYKTVKPLQITPNFADKEGKTNVKLAPGSPETITDVRGLENSFTLDENGFQYVKAPTKFKEWSSQPKIAQEYLPELEALLRREVAGCDEILFYDARIRQSGQEGVRVSGLSHNPFAKQVHVDNTERSVLEKIHNFTEIKADYLLSGRARIINIWRPIKHPVYDCGLAIADGGKLRDGDVIECDRHRQDTGEYWDTMGVIKYRPGYSWYYCSEQAEEDVLLFKNYDGATDVAARTVLHTAFDIPPQDVPLDAPTRESIEVRALIFTYPAGRRPSLETQQEHPLVHHLEASDLKHVDDEQSITDRLRTDIDEADEVKDAVLLLRRQEIRRLERVRDALIIERDNLQHNHAIASTARDRATNDLAAAQVQLRIQSGRIMSLESQVRNLEHQLRTSNPELRKQLHQSAKELTDARLQARPAVRGIEHGLNSHPGDPNDVENELLRQHIERQEFEIQRWKGEAMGRGNEAVSRAWQGSVDEAVRTEREKDGFAVKALQEEVRRLQAVIEGRDA